MKYLRSFALVAMLAVVSFAMPASAAVPVDPGIHVSDPAGPSHPAIAPDAAVFLVAVVAEAPVSPAPSCTGTIAVPVASILSTGRAIASQSTVPADPPMRC